MEAMLWAIAHELAPPDVGSGERDGTLRGVGVSPGRHTGPVRLVRTEHDLHRLLPGDVLVCQSTHSSWTVAFGHAGALVADGGGMLSHPAIIAREHGIPAVLGTGSATSVLREGMMVTVDGAAGRVRPA
jgi:pyruvate,water dikinase